MDNTSILTLLGMLIGLAQFAAQNEIYPKQASLVGAIATAIFGLLAKGTEKKTWK